MLTDLITRRALGVALAASLLTACAADPAGPPAASAPTTTTATESTPSPTDGGDRPDRFHPAAYDAWPAEIPQRVEVDHGLPRAGSDVERADEPVRGVYCDAEAFSPGGELDARRAGASGPEYADLRDLRLFADDREAHRFLVTAAGTARACPEELHGGTRWVLDVTPTHLGEESVQVVQTYETDGTVALGAAVWQVVRVGNAVLVTAMSGEYLPGETLGQGIRRNRRLLAPVISSMCVFSARGCPVRDIPGGFPIAAGWPADDEAEPGHGLEAVGRDLEPLSWELCGRRFSATGFRDRLGAAWNNVEDFRRRELLTFDDADQAVGFTAAMVRAWRDCPRADVGERYEHVHSVRPTEVGGESWALVRLTEYDGNPAVGLNVVHVIRLGRAVLIDSVSNEGGAGSDVAGDVERQIAEQADGSAPVVSAMCRFTEAGCGTVAVLRHDGVGPYVLGMTRNRAVSLGASVERVDPSVRCPTLEADVGGATVRGAFDGRLGLAVISGELLRTPEGIRPGSSLTEVRRAYAHLTGDPEFLLVAQVSDRASYRFEMARGRVDNLMLLHEQQGCGG